MVLSTSPHSNCPSPSERVIKTVADQTGTDPLELPPLYNTLDPDELDALVAGLEDGEIQFQYAGQVVTVYSDGTVMTTNESPRNSEQAKPPADG